MSDAADGRARADAAEHAVLARYVRGLPGIAWGRSASPPRHPSWHYWWSAHLLDAAIDAHLRAPTPARVRRIRAIARGIPLRNGGWSRTFYDDLAWMGLAAHRARAFWRGGDRLAHRIAARLDAAIDPRVGALPWHVGSRLFNAPANAPAAILLARTGRVASAERLADWIDDALRERATGLVRDGVVIENGAATPVAALYTYVQGTALGATVALAPHDERFARRADDLVDALVRWTAPTGMLPGDGGGDGGLFAGIAARWLAEAGRAPIAAASEARALVRRTAEGLWDGRTAPDALVLFSDDAREPANAAAGAPERDLSVQLGAWMTLEAAAA